MGVPIVEPAPRVRWIVGASWRDGRLDTAGRAIPDPVLRPTKPTPASGPDRTQGRRGVAYARAGARGPFLTKEALPWGVSETWGRLVPDHGGGRDVADGAAAGEGEPE